MTPERYREQLLSRLFGEAHRFTNLTLDQADWDIVICGIVQLIEALPDHQIMLLKGRLSTVEYWDPKKQRITT